MISSVMPYVCLYSFYFFTSWWLFNKLFEKRMRAELRPMPFYLFVFLFPLIASVIISSALEISLLSKIKSHIDPSWISFSKSLFPVFMFAYALAWFYGVKCLRKQNEIFIPKILLRVLHFEFKARRASDFAMYFTLAGTFLILTILPWALLKP